MKFFIFCYFIYFRSKVNQQSFAASLIQVGGASNIVRPIVVDFENGDHQPVYQEPFGGLNHFEDSDNSFAKQTNLQDDLVMQHQQQQQLLMMQAVTMGVENKGEFTALSRGR